MRSSEASNHGLVVEYLPAKVHDVTRTSVRRHIQQSTTRRFATVTRRSDEMTRWALLAANAASIHRYCLGTRAVRRRYVEVDAVYLPPTLHTSREFETDGSAPLRRYTDPGSIPGGCNIRFFFSRALSFCPGSPPRRWHKRGAKRDSTVSRCRTRTDRGIDVLNSSRAPSNMCTMSPWE